MNTLCRFLTCLLVPLALHAQDPETDPQPGTEDTLEAEPLVEDAPPPVPLRRTWISIEPISTILSVAPNLQVERMVAGSISVAGSGYWSLAGIERGWELGVRHHFQPGLAGGFLGAFLRGFEEEAEMELPDNGKDRTFTLRQEGVAFGFNAGSMRSYSSGFSLGWTLGLGWPWFHQEWKGATPQENEQMIRNFSVVGAVVEGGIQMGFAF